MTTYEVGYTPTNLRLVIEKLGVTQAALARLLCVSPQSVRNWLMPVGTKSRRDMSHEKWLEVMALLATDNVV
jgi:transcriptional regulator with XRE-family HTH domain